MFKKARKYIGAEIRDSYIRVIEIVCQKEEWHISGANEVSLEAGIVVGGRIEKRKALARSLRRAMASAGPKPIRSRFANFSLPPELVTIKAWEADLDINRGIKQAIDKELKALEEAGGDIVHSFRVLDTRRLSGGRQVSDVVMAAAAREDLEEWHEFFEYAGLRAEIADIAPLALYRGFFEQHETRNLGLVDIGEEATYLSLFSPLGLRSEQRIDFGIQDLCPEARACHFSDLENTSVASEKLTPLASKLKEALDLAADNRVDEDGDTIGLNLVVNELMVCGRGACLPGLVRSLAASLPSVRISEIPVRGFADNSGIRYAQVLGLAIRNEDQDWEKSDPLLSLSAGPNDGRGTGSTKGFGERLLSFIKKLIFIPLFVLTAAFGVWMIYGVISSRLGGEKNDAQPENKEQAARNQEKILPLEEESASSSTLLSENPTKEETKATGSPAEEVIAEKLPEVLEEDAPKKQILIVNSDIGQALNVRKGPGRNFEKIGEAPEGSEQVLLEEKGAWYRIEWQGAEAAWVSAEYLKKKTD